MFSVSGCILLASIFKFVSMLDNYLQQTASADNILDAYFLGVLWVKNVTLQKGQQYSGK